MTLALFKEGRLTQTETINLLALVLQKSDELDLRYGLEELDDEPVSRSIKVILRKLGIVSRKLVKLGEPAKMQRKLQDSPTEQAISRFLSKEASQQETISVLIGATQDYAIKSCIKEADKNGKLNENTIFLLKKLGVLPIINVWVSREVRTDYVLTIWTTINEAGCFHASFLF